MRIDRSFHSRLGRIAALAGIALVYAASASAQEFKIGFVNAAKIVEEGVSETLSYMAFPREHWTRIRTNNPLERIMREIRRRTRVVGAFPDGNSALMLVAARLRHIAGTKWGTRKYLDMGRLQERLNTNCSANNRTEFRKSTSTSDK